MSLENFMLRERKPDTKNTDVTPFRGNVQTRESRDSEVSGCLGLGLGTRGKDEDMGRQQLRGVKLLLGVTKLFPHRLGQQLHKSVNIL